MWAQFFLPYIMTPTATRLTNTTAHHQHIDNATISHVHVIPVVQTRTDNHHATTFGVVGILGKFTRHANDHFRLHACVFLLPSRCIGFVVKIIFGAIFVIQTMLYAIVCQHQIKYSCHQCGFAVCQFHFFDRYFAVN